MTSFPNMPTVLRSMMTLLVIVLVCLLPPSGRAASTSPVAVVHGGTEISAFTERDFRRLFLGTQERWDAGERVTLVLPPPGSETMTWLCRELRVSEHLYWRGLMERALRGDIQKPLQARDLSHALELTAETVGAITPFGPNEVDALPEGDPSAVGVEVVWMGAHP